LNFISERLNIFKSEKISNQEFLKNLSKYPSPVFNQTNSLNNTSSQEALKIEIFLTLSD
jgi:hypothetical protein